jgi:hypothetical protein
MFWSTWSFSCFFWHPVFGFKKDEVWPNPFLLPGSSAAVDVLQNKTSETQSRMLFVRAWSWGVEGGGAE